MTPRSLFIVTLAAASLSPQALAGTDRSEKPPIQVGRIVGQLGVGFVAGSLAGAVGSNIGSLIDTQKWSMSTAEKRGLSIGLAAGAWGGTWAMGQTGDQTTPLWGPLAGAGIGLAVSTPLWLSDSHDNLTAGTATGTCALLGATTGAVLTRRYDTDKTSQARLQLSPPSLSVQPTRGGYQASLRLRGRF